MPIIDNYVSPQSAVRATIVDMRMRSMDGTVMCPNTIARKLRLPTSTVRNVLAQEGIS